VAAWMDGKWRWRGPSCATRSGKPGASRWSRRQGD
jgi:hypothetical protein